ncbi:9933_t:CDS:2, partial [Ambispora leptoticha]
MHSTSDSKIWLTLAFVSTNFNHRPPPARSLFLSNPVTLLNLMLSLPNDPRCHSFNLKLKENPLFPVHLSYIQQKWQVISRDEAFQQFFQAELDRWTIHKRFLKFEKRSINKLNATHGPPGSGKSFFLDAIAELCLASRSGDSDKKEWADNILRVTLPSDVSADFDIHITPEERNQLLDELLNRTVVVPITYISRTSTPFDDENPGVALRMLFSFFFEHEEYIKSEWQKFVDFIIQNYDVNKLTLSTASECILSYQPNINLDGSQKPCRIFLLLDELMKCCYKDGQFGPQINIILTAIGRNSDAMASFSSIVTTLDQQPVRISATKSGRSINWLPLKPINGSILFPQEKYPNEAFQMLVNDCNDHPLTLQILAQGITRHKWGPSERYHRMLNDLLTDIELVSRMGLKPTLYQIIPAILNQRVSPEKYGYKLQKTYAELITERSYINSLTHEDSFIPIISSITLFRFARASKNDEGDDGLIALILSDMLEFEQNGYFESFEKFHAGWEALKRTILAILIEDGYYKHNSFSLSSFYNTSIQYNANEFNPEAFYFMPRKCKVVNLKHHWPESLILEIIHSFPTSNP